MRLDALDCDLLRRAADIYQRFAFPERPDDDPLSGIMREGDLPEEVLARFLDESTHQGGVALHRFVLRLGNCRYPFMKFVLQEQMIEGEYVFCVDTHDEMSLTPDMPDYEAWAELKQFNRDLRQTVESAWLEAGVPTVVAFTSGQAAAATSGEGAGKVVLLVNDDERELGTLQSVLEARGYTVALARDGAEGLAALASDPLPALVLLDFEMPGMDGLTMLRMLREDARTAAVPVLFSTAARLDLADLRKAQQADGILSKPFQLDVLLGFVERLASS